MCPHKVLENESGKWSPRLDLKFAIWQRFVRTRQTFLQTTACLKTGWGQTTRRRYSSLSTRSAFHLQTPLFLLPYPPLFLGLSSPPCTPSTPPYSYSPPLSPGHKKSRIQETLTLSTCGDSRTKITPFLNSFFALLGTFWQRRGCLPWPGLAEALWCANPSIGTSSYTVVWSQLVSELRASIIPMSNAL